MDWAAVSEELQKPLDVSAIKQPAPGKFGEYIDGLHAIREANRIFGEGGWSYVVTRIEKTHEAIIETNKGPQLRISFMCSVKVTVDGAIREGLAVGTGIGKPENAGDVIESAVKEAETDALKRALRSFGNTFGLALYEKDKNKREVADINAPANLQSALCHALYGAETSEELSNILANQKFRSDVATLKEMDPALSAAVGDLVKDRTATFSEKEAA